MKKDQIESPIAAEMKQLAATLLGVSGRDWRAKVADCAPPWLPCSLDDDLPDSPFNQMPADLQLRVRVADMIGNVLIGDADFLAVCEDELVELRAMAAKAGRARRAA
jgi:hypothetical protein